jgi:hypothetical protein
MSLFRKMALPLTLLGAATVLGGCVGEASLEGDDEQETQPAAAEPESADSSDPDAAEAVGTAQQAAEIPGTHSTWECFGQYVNTGNYYSAGEVTIWWGNNAVNALWACNEWLPNCYSGHCRTAALIRYW